MSSPSTSCFWSLFTAEERERLELEAEDRKCTPGYLIYKLTHNIIESDMFDGVLEDL